MSEPATICPYVSPLGDMTLAARDGMLIGCWFDGQKHDRAGLGPYGTGPSDTLAAACAWLDSYFAGRDPSPMPTPPLAPQGTSYQRGVWEELARIPYGTTTTYGRLATSLSKRTGIHHSPRAVGTAIGRNPLSILIPCHRVLGSNGALTGYAGGIERKLALLRLEQAI